MDSMAVPNKYKEMKDFHKYYSGAKKAPVLTLFIGGMMFIGLLNWIVQILTSNIILQLKIGLKIGFKSQS